MFDNKIIYKIRYIYNKIRYIIRYNKIIYIYIYICNVLKAILVMHKKRVSRSFKRIIK